SCCAKEFANPRDISKKGDLFPRILLNLLAQSPQNNCLSIGDAHLVFDVASCDRRPTIESEDLCRVKFEIRFQRDKTILFSLFWQMDSWRQVNRDPVLSSCVGVLD